MTKLLIPAGDEGGELDVSLVLCAQATCADSFSASLLARRLTQDSKIDADEISAWTGLGNPQGGLVFTNAFTGSLEQTHEWTSFMSANDFCFRACRDGPNAPGYCEHIYDTCEWRMPCSSSFPDRGLAYCIDG